MDMDDEATSMDVNPTSTVLATPSENQDSLSQLADEDIDMTEDSKSPPSHPAKGVRIDDHYYFPNDDPEQVQKNPPKGLSDYQAAWYVADSLSDSEEEEDQDDIEMHEDDEILSAFGPEDGEEQSELDAQSQMHIDLSPEEETRQYHSLVIPLTPDENFSKPAKRTPISLTK
jgi:pre-rRNA-processing protein TSR1